MIATKNLGMNYGQHYQSGLPYNASYVDKDLTWMWNHGIRKIRIGNGDMGKVNPIPDGFYKTRLNTMKQICLDAKAKGFYVILVVTHAGATDANWATYAANVNDVADWAWNSGSPRVDEYQFANEMESYWNWASSNSVTNVYNKIRTMGDDVVANHFPGDKDHFASIAVAQRYFTDYVTNGISNIHKIAINYYLANDLEGDLNSVFTKFGNQFYVSEWNVHASFPFNQTSHPNYCRDEDDECVQIYQRYRKLKRYNVPFYFFTYRWDQAGDQFGLYNSLAQKHRKWKNVLFGKPPLYLTNMRRPNTIDHGNALVPSVSTVRCRRLSGPCSFAWQSDDWAMSMWLFPTNLAVFGNVYYERDTINGTGGFVIQTSGDQLLLPGNLSTTDLHLLPNKWNHFVYSVKNGIIDAIINNEKGSRLYNYAAPHTVLISDQVGIGCEANPANNFNFYQGRIDELAFYPTHLTNKQIRTLFERGDSDLPNVPKTLYLKMDESSGLTVADSSGNGKDFTLNSATNARVARPAEITTSRGIISRPILGSVRTPFMPDDRERIEHLVRSNILAFNYGQDTQGGVYNTTIINNDLDKMFTYGVRKLRIAMSDYTSTTGVNTSKTLALAAVARGFYTVWGISIHGFAGATDGNWSDYVAAVLVAADWAWANGIHEFQLGNEIEYSETSAGTLTNSVQKIKDLAALVHDHFPADGVTRFVSYACAQSSMDYTGAPGGWIATGKGPYIHKLGYNAYGDPADLATNRAQWETRITDFYNAFGDEMYMSEWNIGGGPQFPTSETDQAIEIGSRLDFLIALGIKTAYFFCYRWDNGGSSNLQYYPLIISNTYREWFGYLFN